MAKARPMEKCRLFVDVEFDPRKTDAESLATAMDRLLETALSTPGILDDYGKVSVGEFYVPQIQPPKPAGRYRQTIVVRDKEETPPYVLELVSDDPINKERAVGYMVTYGGGRPYSLAVVEPPAEIDLDKYATRRITGYVTVKVEMEVPKSMRDEDAFERLSSECDYAVEMAEDTGVKVHDTELMDCSSQPNS